MDVIPKTNAPLGPLPKFDISGAVKDWTGVPLRADKVSQLPVLWWGPNALAAGATVDARSSSRSTPSAGRLIRVPLFLGDVSSDWIDQFIASYPAPFTREAITFVAGLFEGFLPVIDAPPATYVGGKGWVQTGLINTDYTDNPPVTGLYYPFEAVVHNQVGYPGNAPVGTITIDNATTFINGLPDLGSYSYTTGITVHPSSATRRAFLVAARARCGALRLVFLNPGPRRTMVPSKVEATRDYAGPLLPQAGNIEYQLTLAERVIDDGTSYSNATAALAQQFVNDLVDAMVFTVGEVPAPPGDENTHTPSQLAALVADAGAFFGF